MRKSIFVKLQDDGRDITFKITQMPATKQERWINRVVILLVGKNATSLSGLQAIIKNKEFAKLLGMLDGIRYEDVEPLYDELLECCEHCPDAKNRNVTIPCATETIDGVVTDFRNLYILRMKALEVCFDFFKEGEQSQAPEKQEKIVIGKSM